MISVSDEQEIIISKVPEPQPPSNQLIAASIIWGLAAGVKLLDNTIDHMTSIPITSHMSIIIIMIVIIITINDHYHYHNHCHDDNCHYRYHYHRDYHYWHQYQHQCQYLSQYHDHYHYHNIHIIPVPP